ncbi:PE-PPE domain-containing protein [Gordonia sp. LSe1-13]|uniref:PE-PPE domain-containing protein n=1 Tax=Gordonia sesuvii TaxID=3116777 RepID=A0ABU7MJQ3_9ACTN|nr:PE-PPE domain-containing protein [Gordonia sp. LSe1-13]
MTRIRRTRRTAALAVLPLVAVLGVALSAPPSVAAAAESEPESPVVITDPTTWYPQIVRSKPTWLPADLGQDTTVILVPGSGDRQSVGQRVRTAGIGFYDDPATGESYDPTIVPVVYPAAIGFRLFGRVVSVNDTGVTYNDSVDAGTIAGVDDALRAWEERGRTGTILVNGYSQSGPVAMNIAYELHRAYAAGDPDAIPDENVVVVIGGDTRFPHTGIETVVPSFIPGIYTNGERDPASTGDIEVISYCVRGDYICGLGNPLAHPFETIFYLLPGTIVHAVLGDRVNQYEVVDEWEDGNTTYVILDGGNPWGMMLRALGVPVPTEVDDVLSALVEVPMPGRESTLRGYPIPTPRDVQVWLYEQLGATVPVTDPDVLDARAEDSDSAEDSGPASATNGVTAAATSSTTSTPGTAPTSTAPPTTTELTTPDTTSDDDSPEPGRPDESADESSATSPEPTEVPTADESAPDDDSDPDDVSDPDDDSDPAAEDTEGVATPESTPGQ